MGNNLKLLRDERGWTQPETAEKFGLSFSGYVKLERAERKLSHDRIVKAAEVFGVSEQEVTSRPATVPLIGYVGAGGEADFGNGQGPFGDVDAPPRHTASTVAVEVRGDSMPGIAENRWLLYYDNVQRPLDESMIGGKAPLVVGLSNGRVLVKRVRAGSRPGYYHLLSTGTDDPIIDARVAWAARVTWIKPRWD